MSSVFTINTHITAEIEHSEVHILESNGLLKVYIPMEEEARDISLQHALPSKLFEWIMTNPETKQYTVNAHALGIMKGLLNARVSSVAQILDRDGIMDKSVYQICRRRKTTMQIASQHHVHVNNKRRQASQRPRQKVNLLTQAWLFDRNYPPPEVQLAPTLGLHNNKHHRQVKHHPPSQNRQRSARIPRH